MKDDELLLKYLKSDVTDLTFSIEEHSVTKNGNKIVANISEYGSPSRVNYDDHRIRSFTTIMAEELHNLLGRNVYFDISNGDLKAVSKLHQKIVVSYK